ncbi:TPA: hypothetical protein JBD88_06370 [Legionella pneumophila subsp. pneumophila]|nr:hypothetical protein LPC_2237 [Legionella pneumophila str. Corby]PYB43249.1 hypothetical protein DM454_11885 [Legionella pneumophila]HAT8881687.1 hypothetical protein [Legionella pneumophila subsp. pneumophila]PYB48951.1 hypothetical protein DM456_12565 [Legionella pneumophila]PYB62040.1 hypothetical protein DM455_11835 [Legionella pneumophila]
MVDAFLIPVWEPTSHSLVFSYKNSPMAMMLTPFYFLFLSIKLLSVMLNVRDENSNNKPGCF